MKTSNIFKLIGASNHSKEEREINDYYATDPIAGYLLLKVEPELNNIWECACGKGHLAKVFDDANKLNKATDLINRGYGDIENFLASTEPYHNGDIVTNPPYTYAQEFVENALAIEYVLSLSIRYSLMSLCNFLFNGNRLYFFVFFSIISTYCLLRTSFKR